MTAVGSCRAPVPSYPRRRHPDRYQPACRLAAKAADLVAAQLRSRLPQALLTAAEREDNHADYKCRVLHAKPDGMFSVTAIV